MKKANKKQNIQVLKLKKKSFLLFCMYCFFAPLGSRILPKNPKKKYQTM